MEEIWLTTWDAKNLKNMMGQTTYQLVQDFFHQQYECIFLRHSEPSNSPSFAGILETAKSIDCFIGGQTKYDGHTRRETDQKSKNITI